MSYDGKGEGDNWWERALAMMMAMGQMRGGAAESQIHTTEPISIKVRFSLPLVNAVAVMGSFCGVFAGIFLMAWGVSYLLDLDWDPRAWLLAWSSLVVVAWLVAVLVKRFLKESVRIVQAFAFTAALLVVGIVVGSLLLTVKEKFALELASMVMGAGLVLGSVAFGYNQASELMRGYWRQSPFETAIIKEFLPLFKSMIGSTESGQQDVRTEDPRYMQRNGSQYGVVARPVGVQRPQEDAWDTHEGEETELVAIDPEAGNLVWFVRFAARMLSLSIEDLTIRPSPTLPFQEDNKDRRLRRDMIRRLVARGSTEDEVTVDGHAERGLGGGGFWELRGQGATPEWVVERSEAQRLALEMWRQVYGDELPVPDYHTDLGRAA